MYRGYLAYRVEDDNIIPASDNENEGQGKGLLMTKVLSWLQISIEQVAVVCKSHCSVVLNNGTIFVAQFKQYFIFAQQTNVYNLAIITTIPVYLNVFCNLLSI